MGGWGTKVVPEIIRKSSQEVLFSGLGRRPPSSTASRGGLDPSVVREGGRTGRRQRFSTGCKKVLIFPNQVISLTISSKNRRNSFLPNFGYTENGKAFCFPCSLLPFLADRKICVPFTSSSSSSNWLCCARRKGERGESNLFWPFPSLRRGEREVL